MTRIQKECQRRGITRLCHFTQSRNLAHILGDCHSVLSKQRLMEEDLPYNPTDRDRWDGCEDLVCCSIEFPNAFYFAKVRQQDHLFKDWVVLVIKPDYLWKPGTKFCPTNAATERGSHIKEGFESFQSLFERRVLGVSTDRSERHLPCSPTNIQAEVLVQDPIPLDDIISIAVADEEQAMREICRASLQGISINQHIQFLVAPDFYQKDQLVRSIQHGQRVNEALFDYIGDYA